MEIGENRYEAAAAASVVLAIVGFAVSGQFVSAPGLEVPYFVTLVGIGLLKGKGREQVAPSPQASNAVAKATASPPLSFPPATPKPALFRR